MIAAFHSGVTNIRLWRPPTLAAKGWTDTIRTLHPKAPMFSYWDYKRMRWPRDAGLRIDHILLSPSCAKRLKRGGVDKWVRGEEHASDHAPVWIELGR